MKSWGFVKNLIDFLTQKLLPNAIQPALTAGFTVAMLLSFNFLSNNSILSNIGNQTIGDHSIGNHNKVDNSTKINYLINQLTEIRNSLNRIEISITTNSSTTNSSTTNIQPTVRTTIREEKIAPPQPNSGASTGTPPALNKPYEPIKPSESPKPIDPVLIQLLQEGGVPPASPNPVVSTDSRFGASADTVAVSSASSQTSALDLPLFPPLNGGEANVQNQSSVNSQAVPESAGFTGTLFAGGLVLGGYWLKKRKPTL